MLAIELSFISLSLQTEYDGKTARYFQIGELGTALSIFEKLKVFIREEEFTDGDKKMNRSVFIEGDPDFTSEEKVFIKGLVEGRKWLAADAEYVFSLIEKLR